MSRPDPLAAPAARPGLAREMGLLGLAATGVCSMVGAGLNVIPFMIQRNVPGIGPNVLAAFLLGAVPAVFAGLAYAILGSAMPRAGGSYIYASRSLSPYLGFIASFSQWFALSVAIGVVSYLITPFLRDIAVALEWTAAAATLESGLVRLAVALGFLWAAAGVNLAGVKVYTRLMVPLMFLTFALGGVVVIAGFSHEQAEFVAALAARGSTVVLTAEAAPLSSVLLPASALLFASFIGFDSIAQAGGEARFPSRDLPLAIFIAVGSVAIFYFLFTAAVYHAVPWQYVAAEAQVHDVTAPGLLGYVLPPFWTVVIVASAAVALIKDLPAMLLGVSRLMFAWAADGIFPQVVAAVHPRSPHAARGHRGQRRDGDARRTGQPRRRRLLPRRRHPRHRDARQLPAHGDGGAGAAVTQPGARRPHLGAAGAGAAGGGGGGRRPRAGAFPGGAHVARPDRAGRGVVLPIDAGVGDCDGARYDRLRAGGAGAGRPGRGRRRPLRDAAARVAWSVLPVSSISRTTLAPGLEISRVVTGLWQIADMERDGRTIDLDSGGAGDDALCRRRLHVVRHGRPLRVGRSHRREVPPARRAGDACSCSRSGCPNRARSPRADVRAAVERSLTRLQAPAIDLLQFHAWNYADPSWLDALFLCRI